MLSENALTQTCKDKKGKTLWDSRIPLLLEVFCISRFEILLVDNGDIWFHKHPSLKDFVFPCTKINPLTL